MKPCDEMERGRSGCPLQVVLTVFITIVLFVRLDLESQAGVRWADKDEGRERQPEETAHAEAESGCCGWWFRGAGVGLGRRGAPTRLWRSGDPGLKGL